MAMRPESYPQMRTKRGRMGKRADIDNMFFRSSWEANYARYLNWLKSIGDIQGWEYESETFEFMGIKRGTRFYTPDFKVTEKDGTIKRYEIKGYMDDRSQTKLKRMKKYYPEIEIILIDKDAYYALAKDIKNLIVNWESR